jgi:maltooligosyltrehalose synthase
MDEGLPKLWTTRRTLGLRRRNQDLADPTSAYRPLTVRGDRGPQVVAFLRGDSVAVAVPTRGVPAPWGDARFDLPEGSWTHVLTGDRLTGGTCEVESLFAPFPVALLERDPA